MKVPIRRHLLSTALILSWGVMVAAPALHSQETDPLPSWNQGAAKDAIVEFVKKVTTAGSPDFVAPEERIATFDNDGTLWVEYPMYTQLLFAMDRIKKLAPQHPEWKTKQPFKALLEGDRKTLGESGMEGLMQIVLASHSGLTESEFEKEATQWLAETKQPRFDRLYSDLIYQPQLELLTYLRDKGFKTFIVSGGGVSFMRPFTQKAYGIPREQVVGSSIVGKYQVNDGKPEIVRMPEIDFIDDKAGKPVAINLHIGRRPILAFGNSDGDFEMIEYATSGDGPGLGLFVHHTDADREYAYDREGPVGKLDKGLDQADARGWVIVDMKKDWKTIFPQK